jgi:hypothetical protein
MPASRERAQAASVVIAAVREAVQADERVDMVPARLVEQARVIWGGRDVLVLSEHGLGSGMEGTEDTDMTHAQACAIAHAAGADTLLLVSGYELTLGQVSGNTQAKLAAALALINVGTCKPRQRAVVRAAGTRATAQEALAGARTALARAAYEALQDLLPLHSTVRAVSAHGGAMTHGARTGVKPGQYFDVRRDERVVGQVYVDEVAEGSAEVSLVHGVRRLQAGDRLIERTRPVRRFEVGLTATPSVLERVQADDIVRVATAVHGMLYRPVGSNMYGGSVERLSAKDFSRWRIGIHLGRQVRIVPRRLFAYARASAGLLWARQGLRAGPNVPGFSGGGHIRGFELTGAIGARYLLGDGLVVQLSAAMPLPLYRNTWFLDWDAKWPIPEPALLYASPQRLLPTVSLGAGWTF